MCMYVITYIVEHKELGLRDRTESFSAAALKGSCSEDWLMCCHHRPSYNKHDNLYYVLVHFDINGNTNYLKILFFKKRAWILLLSNEELVFLKHLRMYLFSSFFL